MKNAISDCLKFWTEQNNKKTVDFFKKAKKVIESDKIRVLRISDYNTRGLQGSDKEFNTPWQNLVKASGVSDKGGAAGGSFGIGKSAPFACSDIRTLFYSTKDIDGLCASQGIARLVSFRERNIIGIGKDSITTGTGYYSADKRNSAIKDCISIDPKYTRIKSGTDIFVIGFTRSDDWKLEIIISVLEEFMVAIYQGALIVKVDDIEISAKTLPTVVSTYQEIPKTTFGNYYQVLTNSNSEVVEHEFAGLGTIELHILVNQGLHRRVMMCRKNGMKIFDQKGISSTIQFAGICILKEEKINAYFKEMENPQHDAWEPERHSSDSKTLAAKNKRMLSKYIKDTVIELGRNTTVDEVDAEGVGEYLADINYMDNPSQNKEEAISDKTKDIEISVSKIQNSKSGFERTISADIQNGEQWDVDYGNTGSKDLYDDSHNNIKDGLGYGNNEGDGLGTNGDGDNKFSMGIADESENTNIKSTRNVNMMSIRLFLTDKELNVYTLIFVPEKNAGNGFLKINISGEQSNVNVQIISAKNLLTDETLVCNNNTIYLTEVECKKKNKISFRIAYREECSLEVNLYGYSS